MSSSPKSTAPPADLRGGRRVAFFGIRIYFWLMVPLILSLTLALLGAIGMIVSRFLGSSEITEISLLVVSGAFGFVGFLVLLMFLPFFLFLFSPGWERLFAILNALLYASGPVTVTAVLVILSLVKRDWEGPTELFAFVVLPTCLSSLWVVAQVYFLLWFFRKTARTFGGEPLAHDFGTSFIAFVLLIGAADFIVLFTINAIGGIPSNPTVQSMEPGLLVFSWGTAIWTFVLWGLAIWHLIQVGRLGSLLKKRA